MKDLPLFAAVVLLASTGAAAQMPAAAPATNATAPMPVDAMAYVAKAGASDLYEIQSSQLAIEKGQSARLKGFARMMIAHHTKTTRDLTVAARAAGLTPPPPALDSQQVQMLAQLGPLSGEAFDRAYLDQQKTAHAMALDLHRTYAAGGDTRQLKLAAAKAVPVVQRHIAQLQRF